MNVGLLGVPSDLGANKDGSAKGAHVLLNHAVAAFRSRGVQYKNYGLVDVPNALHIGEDNRRHYRAIKKLSQHYAHYQALYERPDVFPLVFGGDHSITMFHLGMMSCHKNIGLIYFDSHGDFNTPETTPSGNIHGMVVARCVGKTLLELMPWKKTFVQEKNVVLMGIRALDNKEKKLLDRSRVTVITMEQIQKKGCRVMMKKALKIANKGVDGFHLSVDLDSVDPTYAPAVSTPVPGGLGKQDLWDVVTMSRKHGVLSADFVEYIPELDEGCKTADIVTHAVLKLVQ